MKRSSNWSVATRLRALLVTAGLVLAGVVGVASPASADTGGYPYASYYGPGTNPTGSYWTDSSGNDTSPYGYNYRNCTDYVAWKLQSLGVTDAKTRGLGNGGEWADNAQGRAGVSVGTTPSVNSVGVKVSTTSDPFGHVAFVEAVNSNGTLTVSEYNWVVNGTPDGAFHRRTATAASMGLTKFINFGVSSGGGGSNPATRDELLWYDSSTTGVSALGMNAAGNGFSKFWTQTGFGMPDWAGVGDMNGDGKDDVVWYDPNGTVNVETMNSAKNGFRLLFKQTGYGHPVWAGIGDINGDGKDDLLWYESNYTISAVTMNGTGTGFSLLFRASSFAVPDWAGAGDINGDGHDDLLWYDNYTIIGETMNGAGTGFNQMFQAPSFAVPTWAGLANLDGAGPDELLWYVPSTGVSALGLNASGTGLTKFWTQGSYGTPVWAGVGDINGDGHDDLLWYESNYTISAVTMNSAKNGLALMFRASSFARPAWAGLADLNGQ